jgi:hypothetical protein
MKRLELHADFLPEWGPMPAPDLAGVRYAEGALV